ncbi:MAG TPA: hypothetical protein VD997_16105 [Phycisphaerales bacterium]|nr:hypothetical protein [Phycisphaerales bacterium]
MIGQLTALLMSIASAAPAQPESVTAGGARWTPTEPTVGDMNPVGTSQRAMPVDLRVGSGFDRLYKLDARPRFFGGSGGGGWAAGDSDYYMRMNGGVMAVFPRSSYAMTRRGLLTEVPPGTVFSIGGNVNKLMGAQPGINEPRVPGQNFVDRSAKPGSPNDPVPDQERARPAPPERPEPPQRANNQAPRDGAAAPGNEVRSSANTAPAPGPSIWWDESYRQQRVGQLLDRALAGQ